MLHRILKPLGFWLSKKIPKKNILYSGNGTVYFGVGEGRKGIDRMENDILKVLISEQDLHEKVKELGKKISADYRGKNLMMGRVLKGSVVFMADLMREITIPCEIDFMCVSSYGSGTKTSGVVKINKDLDIDLENRDLMIVEDILDSGMTLSYIKQMLEQRGTKSVRICTLLDKPERRQADIAADYSGFHVPDQFVVGYGLDYDEKYRNLPYVGILKPEVYTK